MSENLVSFAKRQVTVTPYWLLKQLAAIDAILIFRFANQTAYISYDIPTERVPRDEYLCNLFNAAPEDFKQEYIAIIWDLIGLPRNECPISVAEIRVPLRPIFADFLNDEAVAADYYIFLRESLGPIPEIVGFGTFQHIQRIVIEAIKDRIVRIEQN